MGPIDLPLQLAAPSPVRRRRGAHDPPEQSAEVALVRKTAPVPDARERQVGPGKQLARVSDAQAAGRACRSSGPRTARNVRARMCPGARPRPTPTRPSMASMDARPGFWRRQRGAAVPPFAGAAARDRRPVQHRVEVSFNTSSTRRPHAMMSRRYRRSAPTGPPRKPNVFALLMTYAPRLGTRTGTGAMAASGPGSRRVP
jgi:hypothetical protein